MNSILNFIHVAGNVLLHSIRTATFCWVAVALVVAVLAVRGVTRKKHSKKQEKNYCLEGMSLGMCFGLVIGMLIPRKAESGDK